MLSVATLFFTLLSLSLVPASWAANVPCGATITTNTILDADLGPCLPGNAVVVQGPATLDLNGKTVSCFLAQNRGVLLTGEGAKLRNGVVTGCDEGVRLGGTGRHRVERVLSTQNVTGFNVVTERNTLKENTAANSSSTGFLLDGNRTTAIDNTAASSLGSGFDSAGVDGLSLRGNTATHNGTHGFVSSLGTNHRYKKNVALQNGGDGFNLRGSGYKLTQNRAIDNASHGIENDATDSRFVRNTALGHTEDIMESFGDCDGNTYSNNIFGTANGTCVK